MLPEPTAAQTNQQLHLMNNPDYFKLSQDHSLDNFNPIASSTEREGEREVQPERAVAAETEAHGASTMQPYQNAAPTQANMQDQEEQGNASNDISILTTSNNAAASAGTGRVLQQAYQYAHTQAGSRDKRRATSKESVERAERFKLNSRKSQDLLAAIKDSADRTASKIKNVSLTRRRAGAQTNNLADIVKDDPQNEAPARTMPQPSEMRPQIQRYQSQQQLTQTSTRKGGNLRKKYGPTKIQGVKPAMNPTKTVLGTQLVRKQKKGNLHTKVSTIQIKLDSLANGAALQASEQTGQYAPDHANSITETNKLQDKKGNQEEDQKARAEAAGAYQADDLSLRRQTSMSNGKILAQAKTTRNERSTRATEKWINQNRSEINQIQEQIAAALTQTSHLIRNQKAIERHDRDQTSRSNSKPRLLRSGTESSIRQRALVRTQSQALCGNVVKVKNHDAMKA